MSISEKNRENIKKYILELIDKDKRNMVQSITEVFSISSTTVYRYLDDFTKKGIIKKDRNRKSGYILENKRIDVEFRKKVKMEEDIIYSNSILPFLKDVNKNAEKIWSHAFTEMLNNAIDHAQAEIILCSVIKNALNTTICIIDNGLGIFNKIVEYNKSVLGKDITLDDAVAELFTGKFTTDNKNHSGEGIFFTSRLVDKFFIYSDGRIFAHDSYDFETLRNLLGQNETSKMSDLAKYKGTIVMMVLSNHSRRNIDEVLNDFSDPDRGFYKTQVLIKNVVPNGDPISRSQAKRLYCNFDKFEEVELDFKDIENIGQAFTHELFIVFNRKHPEIKLIIKNANPKVENMIKRVKNTKI